MFWAGKWVIIIASGLACAALFRWWGRRLSEAMRDTWIAWVDRGAGVVLGIALGVVVATFVLLGALLAPWPSHVTSFASKSRFAAPLMDGGAEACRRVGDSFPGSVGLRRGFLAARARIRGSAGRPA